MVFADRAEAGRLLAGELAFFASARPIIYALPRGGVPVAYEVARALKAPLELVLVRKIGAPGNPELALGAVADGAEPYVFINEDVRAMTGAGDAYIEASQRLELAEIERRRLLYFGDRPRPDPKGRAAIVIDDGLATGATARAAIGALKRAGASPVVLAVPVAPPETAEEMRQVADHVVCLHEPVPFWGVGAFYVDFHQISDDEVLALLKASADAAGTSPAPTP